MRVRPEVDKIFECPMKFLLAFSVVLVALCVSCEAYGDLSSSRYGQMRRLFPSPSGMEQRTWRSATNEGFRDHPCRRQCVPGQPMTCYYYLIVHSDETFGPSCQRYLEAGYRFEVDGKEYVDSLAVHGYSGFDDCKYGDGVKTEVMVVNGLLPGQPVEVCVGDTIVADVINSLHEITTIHWHGLHQRQTPHMDGVPYITQYPIEPGQAFRYRFEVDHVGTHWWHSHVGHQRGIGLAGALIVRQPAADNVHASLYDFDNSEHTIVLQDWKHNFAESAPQSIIIDGVGRNVIGDSQAPTLYSTYRVVRGGRYRFRVIFNGVANCPVSMSIDNHELVVIASDGNDIEPVAVYKLTLHGGERFDFVLHANQPIENYWIRVKGYNFCEIKKLHQEAILHYQGAKRQALPKGEISYSYEPTGREMNPIDKPPIKNAGQVTVVEMNAAEKRTKPVSVPSYTFYTTMSVNTQNGFLFQMDGITFDMPKYISMLQTRNLDIGQFFCNKSQQAALGVNCRTQHCKCANVINVPAFKHVEFVVASTSPTAHPVHLHGYTFRVVGMGVLGEDRINDIEAIDRSRPLERRVRGAPLKDTVQIPAHGYAILRFYTDSPGYWIMHCHISTHSEIGMAAILRVGLDMEMKTCPVSNCGLCNSVL